MCQLGAVMCIRAIRISYGSSDCFPGDITAIFGMIFFGLIFFCVACVLVGVGIVLGLVGCAIAAALLGLGVISSSVFVGLRSGRAEAAIRAFLLQVGIIAGIPAGAVCAWLIQSFFQAYGEGWQVLAYGALGGAGAGLLIALTLDFVSRRLSGWAALRLAAAKELPEALAPRKF